MHAWVCNFMPRSKTLTQVIAVNFVIFLRTPPGEYFEIFWSHSICSALWSLLSYKFDDFSQWIRTFNSLLNPYNVIRHLLVQSRQWEHRNNVGNIFKLTTKIPERLWTSKCRVGFAWKILKCWEHCMPFFFFKKKK